ncbi:MAG TPA: NAD(P)/FAD-dependent oxidoreductase [Roseiflexaceae bacterium]|nr:NAD(P)/FAD-dependent oxidoreductase [Roseiflexaceae bacterium]
MIEPSSRPRAAADVVVIGGGPAGSAVALRLAQQHFSVIQLERHAAARPSLDRLRSGEGLIPGTVRELAALGLATHDPPWALSRMQHMRVCWPDGTRTSNAIGAHGGILQIDRIAFENELLCTAKRAGVHVRCGWRARGLHRTPDGKVAGVLVQPPTDEPPYVIGARIVVDASGRNALSFREFAIRSTDRADNFFAISMFFDHVADLMPDVWETHLFNPQHLAVVQLSQFEPGVVRCGLGMRGAIPRDQSRGPVDVFWDHVQHAPELARRLEHSQVVQRPYVLPNMSYHVSRVTFDGLVLVGDATGYLTPLFGDGILRALVSARRAAGVIASALRRGDCSRRALAPYERQHMLRNWADHLAQQCIRYGYQHPALISRFGSRRLARRALFAALMRN